MNIDVECPADSEVVHQMLAYEATRARNSEESRGQRAMNTIIILDVSGSMSGEPFIQAALFINQFITGLEQMQFEYNLEENVALVTVSEKAEVVQHFTNNYSQIRRAVDVLIAGGSSRFHMGLVMPTALLSAGPRDGRAGLLTIHEHLVCPRVIFISDGQVSHEADVPGQTLKHDDPRVNMMQNLCTQMVQQVTGRTLCRMYCVPVGDYNQVFLEVLCEEAGGRVLQQREAIMASRAHLHHNVVAKLKLTRSDEPSRETISSTMKTVTGSEEEGEVDAVLEIWRQGEPDIEARSQKVANDARQRRESGVPGVQDGGQGQLHDGVPMMGAGLGLGRGGSLAGMFGSGRGMPAFGGMGGRDFAGHLGAEGRGILPVGGGGGNRGGGEMVMPPVGGMWAGDFLGRKGEASQKPYGSSSANNGAVPKTRVNKIALDAKSSARRSLSGESNGTKPKTVSKITETQDEMMQISDSDDSETSGDDSDSEDEEEIEQNLPINDLRRKGFKVRSAEEMKALCDEHKKKTLKQLKAMKKQWRQEEKAESARLRAIPDEEMSPLMRISAQLKGGKDVVRKHELSWWQSELYDVMTDSEDELEQDKRGKENLCKVFNLDPNIFKRNRENVDSPEEEVISEKDGKENEADSGARPKQQKPAWKSHRLAGNQIDDCSSTDEMEVKVERPRRRKPHHSKKGGDQGRFDTRRQNSNTTRMKPETDTSGEDDKPIGGLG